MSKATPSFSRTPVSFFASVDRASTGSLATRGSANARQTDVQERVLASFARKSIHDVWATHLAIAAKLLSERAISALSPPALSAHLRPSSASSTQSIEGVLIVSPLNTPSISFPPLL